MLEISDAKELVLGIVQHDPLFIVLQHTPLEETLYGDAYLTHIHEKNIIVFQKLQVGLK